METIVLQESSRQPGGALTFALQVRPRGFEDGQEDGEQLHQVPGDVARRRLVVHHVQSVEGLRGQTQPRHDRKSQASFVSSVATWSLVTL